MKTTNFNPLTFLAALGAGGIAVAPFVFFQYVMPHGKGLITYQELMSAGHGAGAAAFFYGLMAVMVIFTLVHLILTATLFSRLAKFMKTPEYRILKHDPLKNSALLAPFVSVAMTMNVFIGVIRFFIPALQSNFQSLMLPALMLWAVIWLFLMRTEVRLLKISFTKDFDVSKISFGWLLHPFALAMVTVTGTGIAAMAKNPDIAHAAAFMSMVSGMMGAFLFTVKIISVFTSHFHQAGVPERQFLPSFLIVVPIVTLFAISLFRLGHYFEHQFHFHLDAFFTIVVVAPFAFQTWYFLFGLSMLKDYFKKDIFKREYYVSLWAFICPFVGYAVLGSFVYKFFSQSGFVLAAVFVSLLLAVIFYAFVAKRYFSYGRQPALHLKPKELVK